MLVLSKYYLACFLLLSHMYLNVLGLIYFDLILGGIEMNMQEIRVLAKNFGIKSSRMSKVSLVKTIQLAEGNFGCFASATNGECDQQQCCWRDDCFSAAKKLQN